MSALVLDRGIEEWALSQVWNQNQELDIRSSCVNSSFLCSDIFNPIFGQFLFFAFLLALNRIPAQLSVEFSAFLFVGNQSKMSTTGECHADIFVKSDTFGGVFQHVFSPIFGGSGNPAYQRLSSGGAEKEHWMIDHCQTIV